MNPAKPAQVPTVESLARVSYAQNMEDILIDRVFHGRPGTFMDVGANHPFLESNTYFFYLRGWRGVNLEPIPRNHALFLRHRPEDLNLDLAASDFDGELTFHEIADGGDLTGHSSLSDEVAEEHRARGFAVSSYPVTVRTVASIVAEHRIEPPDFLSIDVECHEGAVIRGIPWATWRPKLLVVESLLPISHEASHGSWEPTLLENGYVFAAFNGLNRFYLREDLRDRLPLLQTPVNCLDQYERADQVLGRAEVEEARLKVDYLQREYDRLSADRAWDRDNFDRIRAGWEWGQSQAELARQGFEREKAAFEWHRDNFEKALAGFERERAAWEQVRADLEKERAAWEQVGAERDEERAARAWERIQFEKLLADRKWEQEGWELQRAAWERERAAWGEAKAEFDRRWADWEWERAASAQEREGLRSECEAVRQQLVATQRSLRPYRLLDRLGVVSAGYGMARGVKRRLVR